MKNLVKPGISFLWYVYFLFILSCNHGENNRFTNRDKTFESDTVNVNNILNRLASSEISDKDSSLSLLKKAEELSRLTGYTDGLAQTYFQYGNYYYSINDYQKALFNYKCSDSISLVTGNSLLNARCLERMASVHLSTNDPALALKLYYQALPIFEQLNDKSGLAKVLNILGVYRTEIADFDSAEKCFSRALSYSIELKEDQGIINIKGNLADMYERKGLLPKSRSLYQELISDLTRRDDKQILPILLYNYANFFIRNNIPDSSEFFIEKAIYLSEANRDTSLLPELYMTKAGLLSQKKDFTKADEYYRKAFNMANKLDSPELAVAVLDEWIQLDTLRKNYRVALKHMKEQKVIQDTLNNRRERSNIQVAEAQYHTEKANLMLEIRKAELDSAKVRQRIFQMLIVLIAVSSLIIVYVINSRKRLLKRKNHILQQDIRIREIDLENAKNEEEIQRLKHKEAEELLRVKKSEQLGYAMALDQKTELLNQIFEKIRNSKSHQGSLSDEELNHIQSAIRMQMSEMSSPELFTRHLTELHENFYILINKLHPDLTPAEQKFCAFIRVHLSNEQIAAILNVTHHAVKKTRYRIRKKINLSTDQSLEEYILNI